MRKRFRRAAAMLLAVVMIVGVFSGCEENPASPTYTQNSTKVELQAGDLVISELMSSNSETVADDFGEHSDWIELHNTTDRTISLDGLYIADSESKPKQYELPDVTIAPGGYLLIFASDRGLVTEDGQIHTNFKISTGETVVLTYKNQTIFKLAIPADLPADISYGLISEGNEWTQVYFASATPGKANAGAFAEVFGELGTKADVKINEFMMQNEGIVYDEDGDCPDWVEIRNYSNQPVSLAGYGLSDRFDDPQKWLFPDITLEPGACLLVLLSGKDKAYTENSLFLHAGFKLGSSDDGLILSNQWGIMLDRIAVVSVPDNASYGRDSTDSTVWKFFTKPTPGAQNGANGFDSLEATEVALTQKLYISEVCAVSSSTALTLPKQDWIELYNNTPEAINLSGWSLSKYISDLRFFKFPDVTIEPYSYLVITASATASQDVKSLDAGFKVSHTGNTLYLTDPDGFVTDSFSTGMQRTGVTSGRVVQNNKLTRMFFTKATKGTKNDTTGAQPGYAQPVSMESSAGVLVAQAHTVTMTTIQPHGTIYYTLDGSEPDETSLRYEGPVVLEKSAAIRAVVYADGCLPSQITTQTFLMEQPHDLNVVCLTAEPDALFSEESGIWANGPGWTSTYPHQGANFWQDWERECYFEYYELDGTLGISFGAGIKNHGQYSRAEAQKSVSINLKEIFNSGTSYYPFFGEGEIAVFDNLLLRTGGQDIKYTNIIDAYCARVVAGQMDLDYMRDVPVAVYVNGEYWGLYYLREKINEAYIENHHGIEEDNLDAIKGVKRVETGSFTAHNDLLNYISKHDMSNPEYFAYVASQIDLEEWTNYWIAETYLSNTDTGNIRFYHAKDNSVKWRWILFDMDWALFRTTYHYNMIEEFIDPKGHGVGNAFSTTIAVNLMKNPEFKTYFIEQYAYHMNTTFRPERMLRILEDMVDQVDSEMVRQCQRWGFTSYSKWEQSIEKLRTIIKERWDYSKGDLQDTFNLSDAYMKELFPEE